MFGRSHGEYLLDGKVERKYFNKLKQNCTNCNLCDLESPFTKSF